MEILDTREIDEKIDELAALEADYLECKQAYEEVMADPFDFEAEEVEMAQRHYFDHTFDEVDAEELKQLRDFKDALEGYCEWQHGEALIHEDHREDYARELASDIGAITGDENWPLNFIDWKAATEELFRYDYTSAELDGETYYVRVS